VIHRSLPAISEQSSERRSAFQSPFAKL
jgi:hypothetical protein